MTLKGWVPSSPASALLRKEESITVQHRAAFTMVSSSPTHRVTWVIEEAGFQPECKHEMWTKKMPCGVFFPMWLQAHWDSLRKMTLCLVTTGRKAPLEAASLGCPDHIFKGRSLVICSWLPAYHCAHMSGSTSVAKIKDHQFWFYSFPSLYLTSSSLKWNFTPRAVTQETMTTTGRGSIQILSIHSIPIHDCTLLKSTWFV